MNGSIADMQETDRDDERPAVGDDPLGCVDLPAARGTVLLVRGGSILSSGGGNSGLAASLRARSIGTLIVDLMTPDEEIMDRYANHMRYNIPVLARRLVQSAERLSRCVPAVGHRPVCCFASGTFAAAAVVAAERRQDLMQSLVLYAPRLDLVDNVLPRLRIPTLLVVDDKDFGTADIARQSLPLFGGVREMTYIRNARNAPGLPAAKTASLISAWAERHSSGVWTVPGTAATEAV